MVFLMLALVFVSPAVAVESDQPNIVLLVTDDQRYDMLVIIRDPRGSHAVMGRTVHRIVLNLDLPETILDLAGVVIPSGTQGRSLLPIIQGKLPTWRTDTFLEHSWTLPPNVVIPRHESLRSEHMKYIHYIDHDWEELYNLTTDIDEAVNLASVPIWSVELQFMRERTVELRNIYSGLIFEDGFESGDLNLWEP